MKARWVCIEISCRPDRVDELASEVAAEFQVGVEVLAEGVRCYLSEEGFQNGGRATLDAVLAAYGVAGDRESLHPYRLSVLFERDWMEEWKRGFKALRVGKHLIIAPTWEELVAKPDELIIRIDPGQAFGTGHHETTRLCLEWLEARSETFLEGQGQSLLDVGAGSGILAIAAARLGFGPILGVDNDSEAIAVARGNLRLNVVEDQVMLRVGTVETVTNAFAVVVANIQALPLIEMAPCMVRRLESSGRLVLSGILIEQAEAVRAAYDAHGLQLHGRQVAGEWCLMEFAFAKGRQQS